MTWGRIRASKLATPERIPWYAIAVCSVVFLGLLVGSAVDYTGVTMAHVNTSLFVDYQVRLRGTDAQGVLTDNGSITAWLNLSVDNPSPRLLSFLSVSYKVWAQDPAAPANFYLTLFSTKDVPPTPVPPWSNTTLGVNQTLTRASDPARFGAVQTLQRDLVNRTGTAAGLAWFAYVLLSLPIQGVPPAAVTAATYQFNVNRVILSWGTDYGIGVNPFGT